MSYFKIITDSTADLPKEFLLENKIGMFSLSYEICGEVHSAGNELPPSEFYQLMRAGNATKTSQVNPDQAKEGFLAAKDECKDILYIAFSSGLSGTFNSVRLAAEELMEEDPSFHITVIDSKCASLGEGLLVYKAVEMRNQGKSLDETVSWINDNIYHFVHMFTVDDLNHLYRGGRVSKSTAIVGTVLNIKPVLHVDDEGHLVAIGKERGRKKALLSLVDYMEKKMGSFRDKNDIVFISHCDCLEDAEFVKEEIKNRFGIEKFIINFVGPTIGSHSGPGTIALFFMGDER